MTSETRRRLVMYSLFPALAAALLSGCGNYSNEDLEYMNALPEREDLAAELPQAVVVEDAAELYRMTNSVMRSFNGTVEAFLALIDGVRGHPPTSRTPTSRTWGPAPSREHPGWQTQMVVSRGADPSEFIYELGFLPATDDAADVLPIITGSFRANGGVRRGIGTMKVDTAAARAAGIALQLGRLDRLDVMYNTMESPLTVNTTIVNLPDPLKPDDLIEGVYQYEETTDRRGAMVFDFLANSIPGVAVERFRVTSRWLATGAGRADVEVLEGDGAGARQAQCWDRRFQPTYTSKPWAPAENLGDPSACPDIPML